MEQVLLAFATFLSTLAGGIVAIKNKRYIHHILGFTAGIILGVIAFDILPELFKIVHASNLDATWPMIALVVGFLAFHILEKNVLIHHAHEEEYGKHRHPQVGIVSALALSGHSFLDGVGIGLGFQVSSTVGLAVAIAVIGHDFADGLNTVSLMLSHKNSVKRSVSMLVVNAFAPVLGVLSTMFFQISDANLVIYLGFFAGFLLYIGASDILPQAHEETSSRITIGLTVSGAAMMFVLTRFI
ncbi:MAG: ZIP family metal transporter [Candidatus Saccharibacteria bacterium]